MKNPLNWLKCTLGFHDTWTIKGLNADYEPIEETLCIRCPYTRNTLTPEPIEDKLPTMDEMVEEVVKALHTGNTIPFPNCPICKHKQSSHGERGSIPHDPEVHCAECLGICE